MIKDAEEYNHSLKFLAVCYRQYGEEVAFGVEEGIPGDEILLLTGGIHSMIIQLESEIRAYEEKND